MAASIDYNNPLAQWENRFTSMFGSGGFGVIGGGNHIAQFGDPVSGASANVATMLGVYGNSSVADMISRWSGGNNSGDYINYVTSQSGVDPSANVRDVLSGPSGPAFLNSMAQWEAGAGNTLPLGLGDWQQALTNGFSAVGGSYSPDSSSTLGGSGGVQQTAGAGLLPNIPGITGPLFKNMPGSGVVNGVLNWIQNQVTRGSLIFLGGGLVLIGAFLLARTPIMGIVEQRREFYRGRQAKYGGALAKREYKKTAGPSIFARAPKKSTPAAPAAPAATKTRKQRARGGRIRRPMIRTPRNRGMEETIREAQRAAGRDEVRGRAPRALRLNVGGPLPRPDDNFPEPPKDIGDAARMRRTRKRRKRETYD